MAVTPGSATKLNPIKGVAHIIEVSEAEQSSLGDVVFASGIILKMGGKLYLTDGTTALNKLVPIVDGHLTAVEQAALDAAFSTGAYVPAENGVVVLGAGAKIADAQLNVVADGKIVESYLSDFVGDDHKIKLEKLPEEIRAHIKFVADITARDALGDEDKKGIVFVADATADATVDAGWATYVWTTDKWTKVSEGESLDIDIDALTPNYENVQTAGAVMYDHPVSLEGLTLTELNTLSAAANA